MIIIMIMIVVLVLVLVVITIVILFCSDPADLDRSWLSVPKGITLCCHGWRHQSSPWHGPGRWYGGRNWDAVARTPSLSTLARSNGKDKPIQLVPGWV